MIKALDILAFGAHPDDVELSAGGTLIMAARQGKRTGVVDLTRGELGTRGTAETRATEAAAAAKILGLAVRENLGLRDGLPEDEERALMGIVKALRKYRPQIVLANALGDRHPDHGRAASLVQRAVFLSGLVRIETSIDGQAQMPHRPRHLLHYIQDRFRTPDVVVDISGAQQDKFAAIGAYVTQFHQAEAREAGASEAEATEAGAQEQTPISTPEFLEILRGRDLMMGRSIGVLHGEGFESAVPIGIENLDALIR
jgi:bacillithiol biosynthesis deacetylase BshB1